MTLDEAKAVFKNFEPGQTIFTDTEREALVTLTKAAHADPVFAAELPFLGMYVALACQQQVLGAPLVISLARLALEWDGKRQGGIAGQAFTDYTCRVCNRRGRHPNTNTPLFCVDCRRLLQRIIEA